MIERRYKCSECENALFDSVYGEFKCSIKQIVMRNIEVADCEHYNKGKPGISKNIKES